MICLLQNNLHTYVVLTNLEKNCYLNSFKNDDDIILSIIFKLYIRKTADDLKIKLSSI